MVLNRQSGTYNAAYSDAWTDVRSLEITWHGREPPACFDGPAGCSSDYAQVDEERNTKKERPGLRDDIAQYLEYR